MNLNEASRYIATQRDQRVLHIASNIDSISNLLLVSLDNKDISDSEKALAINIKPRVLYVGRCV